MPKVNVYFNPEGKEILVEGTSYTPTSEVEQLRERVKQLEALGSYAATEMIKTAESKNALAAQVEQLREVINHYQMGLVPSDNAMDELIHRLTKTPARCLAEIKAQVARLRNLHSDLTNADMVFDGDVHTGYLITNEQIDEFEHLLAEPDRCLAEVKAQAINDFVNFVMDNDMSNTLEAAAFTYNRQQAKAGECYFDAKGILRNTDGSRSIFDDVDE